jgi:hypothetical protein
MGRHGGLFGFERVQRRDGFSEKASLAPIGTSLDHIYFLGYPEDGQQTLGSP